MKKLIALILLIGFMVIPLTVFGAGTVTQALDKSMLGKFGIVKLTFTCTGDASDGSIPNTSITQETFGVIAGMYLYSVTAYPTSGGTAPEAADVMIYDANSLDLLGSEDGGSTAYNGLNLIDATLTRSAIPNMYIPRGGDHLNYYPLISSILTLDVDNQDTVDANYTIELIFIK